MHRVTEASFAFARLRAATLAGRGIDHQLSVEPSDPAFVGAAFLDFSGSVALRAKSVERRSRPSPARTVAGREIAATTARVQVFRANCRVFMPRSPVPGSIPRDACGRP